MSVRQVAGADVPVNLAGYRSVLRANQKGCQRVCLLLHDIYGRGGQDRTDDIQFWRLALYQLSYTPMEFRTGKEYIHNNRSRLFRQVLTPGWQCKSKAILEA
jgi:hypothetical protein